MRGHAGHAFIKRKVAQFSYIGVIFVSVVMMQPLRLPTGNASASITLFIAAQMNHVIVIQPLIVSYF